MVAQEKEFSRLISPLEMPIVTEQQYSKYSLLVESCYLINLSLMQKRKMTHMWNDAFLLHLVQACSLII